MKIALAMIVAGYEKPESVERCIKSVSEYVDGIFITITTPIQDPQLTKMIKNYGGVVSYEPDKFLHAITKKERAWIKKELGYDPHVKVGDPIFLFSEARNHSFAQVPKDYEWILWMDADDVFRNGHMLRQALEESQNTPEGKADSLFMNYLYQVNMVDGKVKDVIVEHLRERVIRNDGSYKWVANIHETLIEERQTLKIQEVRCDVLHMSNMGRMTSAINRNVKALEYSIYEKEGKDPRPIYYLAKAFFDLKSKEYIDLAFPLFQKYIKGSGWAEERCQAWCYIAEICRMRGDYNNAIKANHNALIESNIFPYVYVDMAMNYILKQEWERALFWVRIAAKIPEPISTLVNNPRDVMARSLEVVYNASINTSKLDEAWASAKKLMELLPENPEMKKRFEFTEGLKSQRETLKGIINIANNLKAKGEQGKLKALLTSVPNDLINNPFITKLYKEVFPPRTWEDDEVAIFCGPGFTNWSPAKLKDPGGNFVGGSEEAVIYLSAELKKLGWKVTVFCDPGDDEGDHDGVNYLPYYKFNAQDKFNILIGWRNIKFFDGNYEAKKKYVWAHDILNPLDHTEERIEKVDKVFVLSPWHRTNIPKVPDDKVMITGNGIHI